MFSQNQLKELIEQPRTQRSIIAAIKADRDYPFEVGGDVSYRTPDRGTHWLYFRQVPHNDLYLLEYLDRLGSGKIIKEEIESLKRNAEELTHQQTNGHYWKEILQKIQGIENYEDGEPVGLQKMRNIVGSRLLAQEYRGSCKYYYRRDRSVPKSPKRIANMHAHEKCDRPSDTDIEIVKTSQTPEFIICHGIPDSSFAAEVNPEKPHPLSRYCVIVLKPVLKDGEAADVVQYRFGDYLTGETHDGLVRYPFKPFLRIPTKKELEAKYGEPLIYIGEPKPFKGGFVRAESV